MSPVTYAYKEGMMIGEAKNIYVIDFAYNKTAYRLDNTCWRFFLQKNTTQGNKILLIATMYRKETAVHKHIVLTPNRTRLAKNNNSVFPYART